jgi:hypothetical protein
MMPFDLFWLLPSPTCLAPIRISRQFAAQGTCGDLEEQCSNLAAVLANALEDLRAERYDACVTASEELRANTWNVRSTEKDSTYGGGGSQWPHVSYREAHVFSLLFLGCAYASGAAPDYSKGINRSRPLLRKSWRNSFYGSAESLWRTFVLYSIAPKRNCCCIVMASHSFNLSTQP